MSYLKAYRNTRQQNLPGKIEQVSLIKTNNDFLCSTNRFHKMIKQKRTSDLISICACDPASLGNRKKKNAEVLNTSYNCDKDEGEILKFRRIYPFNNTHSPNSKVNFSYESPSPKLNSKGEIVTNIRFHIPIRINKQCFPSNDQNLKSISSHIDGCPECRANMILNGWNTNKFQLFNQYSEPKTKLKRRDSNTKKNHSKRIKQLQLNRDDMLISIGKKFLSTNKCSLSEHPKNITKPDLIKSMIGAIKPETETLSLIDQLNYDHKQYEQLINHPIQGIIGKEECLLITPKQKFTKPNTLLNRENYSTMYKSQVFSNKKLEECTLEEQRPVSPNSLKKLQTIIEETSEVKEEISKKISTLNYMSIMNSNKFKYSVLYGNNCTLIKCILENRPWWIELPCQSNLFNFRWQPFSNGFKFSNLSGNQRQMINHFEFHKEITSKNLLFTNLQTFLENNRENVFLNVPITFSIEININKPNMQLSHALHNFISFYQVLEMNKKKIVDILQHPEKLEENSKPVHKNQKLEKKSNAIQKIEKLLPTGFDKRGVPQYVKFVMPLNHFRGYNLWLLKPTSYNRGRGIHVFKDLDKLEKLMTQYIPIKKEKNNLINNKNKNEIKINQQAKSSFIEEKKSDNSPDQSSEQKVIKNSEPAITSTSFIIQKYIENPLLINNRKFDIRVWSLVNHEGECFFFKEGYLRTSSCPFEIDIEDIDNKFIHLTNNAVQKYSQNYGEFEDGNQMSFLDFQKYIDQHYAERTISIINDIIPSIKNLIKKTLLSIRKKINSENRKYCFEIFGYDFIIDNDFNAWLIEINTNPCLELSSDLLKKIIPRMVDDAFKLTLDLVFPPIPQYANLNRKVYSVDNYLDEENMWERLCNLNDNNFSNLLTYNSLKSQHIIMINELKNLKVKKYIPSTPKKFSMPSRGNKKIRPQMINTEEVINDTKPELGIDSNDLRDEPSPLTGPISLCESIIDQRTEVKVNL